MRTLDDRGYPVKPCDKLVEGSWAAYPCRIDEGHDGPCEAIEVPRSVSKRQRWLQEEADKVALEQEKAFLRDREGRPELEERPPAVFLPTPLPVSTRRPKNIRPISGLSEDEEKMIEEIRSQFEATEPTKQRKGDQPLPKINDNPFVADLLIERFQRGPEGQKALVNRTCEMIEERKQIGIQRYGTPLQTFNGRDAVQDAVEEALDLVTYLFQAILEGKVELIEYLNNAARILTSLISFQDPSLIEG